MVLPWPADVPGSGINVGRSGSTGAVVPGAADGAGIGDAGRAGDRRRPGERSGRCATCQVLRFGRVDRRVRSGVGRHVGADGRAGLLRSPRSPGATAGTASASGEGNPNGLATHRGAATGHAGELSEHVHRGGHLLVIEPCCAPSCGADSHRLAGEGQDARRRAAPPTN